MPTNLLKTYNQLLELNCLTEHQRILSLKGVFNRDFVNNPDFSFRKKKLNPTPAEGEDTMERFFRPYVLDVAEYTIFDIQYLFQFAHLDSR